MPELPEDMYCSQQICIPPVFPYLLRQYAKAAIRTQPSDLLKWSTAYFRCLALNLPPPVKPRLEYPIPLDYHSLTPGWLKALVNQMPNVRTVSFKLLWDRWIGACLNHNTLIEILLLGRFTDNMAIPWLNFIALCAGHLTENLTHTMIMVCELLTEEPEGGSAMILVHQFMDIYRFLADIDASRPQHLPNIYFTDSVLGLYEEEEVEESAPSVISSEQIIKIEEVEEEKEVSLSIMAEEDTSAVVSCPDIAAEEKPDEPLQKTAFPPKGTEVLPDSIDKTLKFDADKVAEEEDERDDENALTTNEVMKNDEAEATNTDAPSGVEDNPQVTTTSAIVEISPVVTIVDAPAPEDNKKKRSTNTEADVESDPLEDEEEEDEDEISRDIPNASSVTMLEADDGVDVKAYSSVDTIQENVDDRFKPKERQQIAQTNEEALNADRVVVVTTDETQQSTIDQIQEPNEWDSSVGGDEDVVAGQGSYKLSFRDGAGEEEYDGEQKRGGDDDEQETILPRYEWFDIPIVPGIGPTVPIELVEIVDEYMNKMAKIQHGVVMPRNIRHFSCPPLEIFDFQEE